MTTQYTKISELPPFIGTPPGSSLIEMVSGSASWKATISQTVAANPASLPIGGLTGEGLLKASNANYDTLWAPLPGVGTVISVGLALPSGVFSVSNSPITTVGTMTGSLINQTPNTFFAGASSGTSTPAFRAIVGADLPTPTPSALGAVRSYTATGSLWLKGLSTSGTFTATQPAFSDLSGVAPVSQGGTGTSTLVSLGLIYGNGTSAVSVTASAANSVLVTSAASIPSLSQTLPLSVQQNITTLGITIFGTGTWNGSTIAVSYGGTGTSTLAAYGLVYGNGTANVGVTNSSANSILVTNATNVPSLSQTLPLAVQQNQTTVGTIASGVWNSTAVTVPFGGTGATSLTAHGIVIGEGTASVAVTAAMSGGQLLVGQTSTSDPVPRSIVGDISLSAGGTASISASAVGTTALANNSVGTAKIAQFVGLSVLGVTGTSVANIGAIVGAANQSLVVNSGATALSFGLVSLSAGVTGTLPIANGGTNGTTAATALSNLGAVSLTGTSQALSAGFNVTPYNIGTASGTLTLNYGSGTMQRLINNGAFTLAAPATDGETDLLITNAASASTITITGFNVGSNTGDTYGTSSGNKFFFMSRTANGSSTYGWKAFQVIALLILSGMGNYFS